MADPVELVRRLCLCSPPRLQPPQRSRRPRCLVRARPRIPGSPLSLGCRALDASRPAAVEGEQSEEYDDDEEPYFSVTSSRLSEVDYLGESTKGDLNVRRRHLDALGGNGKSTLHGPIEEIAWKEARQAETLLSDLGIADPLTVRHSPRGIFCTRTLNLRSISVIGYDMDYTLIHYNVMAWEGRAYDYGMANLKSMGFLVDDLEFDPDLVIRGLIMDKEKGNLVKADRFGYIKRVMHGTQMLPTRAVSEIYGRELVDLRKEDTWEFLNTLFSVSEAVMFMQMVDKLDQGLVPAELGPLDYKGLYNAVSKALFRAHVEGQLKSEIMAEPERFVEPDPELPLALLDQKEAGKRLLLITNSDYHYTNKMMNHAFNRFLPNDMGWRDLFEMVIVSARKPEFFQISHPLYEVVTDDGLLRPCFKANSGGLYSGGCAQMVEKSLDIHGDEILYVGDHIFTDVSQSKVHLRWRTALICRELEDEFDALIQSHAQKEKLVTLIQQKEIVGDLFNQLRLALQRRTNSRPAQTLAATCMNDQELTESMQKLLIVMQRLDEKIVPLLESDGELFNKRYKDHYCQVPMSIFYVTSTSNVWFPAYFPDQICSLQKKWRLSLISVKSQGIIVIFASYLNIFVISNVYDCHSGTNVLRRPVSLGSLHTL